MNCVFVFDGVSSVSYPVFSIMMTKMCCKCANGAAVPGFGGGADVAGFEADTGSPSPSPSPVLTRTTAQPTSSAPRSRMLMGASSLVARASHGGDAASPGHSTLGVVTPRSNGPTRVVHAVDKWTDELGHQDRSTWSQQGGTRCPSEPGRVRPRGGAPPAGLSATTSRLCEAARRASTPTASA